LQTSIVFGTSQRLAPKGFVTLKSGVKNAKPFATRQETSDSGGEKKQKTVFLSEKGVFLR